MLRPTSVYGGSPAAGGAPFVNPVEASSAAELL
jgi:hypothetical protein